MTVTVPPEEMLSARVAAGAAQLLQMFHPAAMTWNKLIVIGSFSWLVSADAAKTGYPAGSSGSGAQMGSMLLEVGVLEGRFRYSERL
jgi:hypothetical protein